MIRLSKGDKPQILVDNENQWNADYVALRLADLKDPAIEGRHRHPQIKAAVITESFDKCIYCEEKLSSAQFGDVEHILPKKTYPHLYVTWENLGLACDRCNSAKSTHVGFVNPFQEEPSDFISFVGPFVRYDPGNAKGQITVKGLKLNRLALLERRAIALEKLIDKLDLLEATPPGPIREILEVEVQEAVTDDKEYAGALRAYLAA